MATLPLTFNTGVPQATGNLLTSGIGIGKSFQLNNLTAQSSQLITGLKLFTQTLDEFKYIGIYPEEFTNKQFTFFNKSYLSSFFVNVEPQYSHVIVPKPYWNQNSFRTEDSYNLGYADGYNRVRKKYPIIHTGGNIYTISDISGVRPTRSGESMRIYDAGTNASLNFEFDIKTTGLVDFVDKKWTGYIDIYIVSGFKIIDPYKGVFYSANPSPADVETRISGKATALGQKYQLPIVIDLKDNQTKITKDDYYFIYASGLKPIPTILTNQIFKFSSTGFLNLSNKIMGLTFYSTGLNVTSGKVYQEILRKVNRIGEYSNTGLYSGLKFIYPSLSGEAYFSAKSDKPWIQIDSPIQNFRWITGYSGFFTGNSYNPSSGALQQDLILKIDTQDILPNNPNTGNANFLVTSSGSKYLFNGILDTRGNVPFQNPYQIGPITGTYFVQDQKYRFLTTGNNKFIPINRNYKSYKASNGEIIEITATIGWSVWDKWPPIENTSHQKPDGTSEYISGGEFYSFSSNPIFWSGNSGVGSFAITEKIIPRYFSGTKDEEWYLYNYKPVNLYTNNSTALYTTGEAEAMGQPPKPAKNSPAATSILNQTFKNNLGVSFYNEQLRISTQPEIQEVPWVANKFALSEPDKTRPTFYAGAIPKTGCPPSYYFQGYPIFASWNFSTNSSYTGSRNGDGSIPNRIIPYNPQCLLRDQVRTQLNQLERFESNHLFGPQIQLVQGKKYHFIRVGLTDWEITGMPLVFEENIALNTTTGNYKIYQFPNQIRFNHKTVDRNTYPKEFGGFKAGFFMEGHSPKWRNPNNVISSAFEFKKFEYISFVVPSGITGKAIHYGISGADRIAGLVQIFPSGYEVFSSIKDSTAYNNNLPKMLFSGNIEVYNSDLSKNKITIPVLLSGVNNTDYIKF
jgi:hypothetical protein